MKSNTDSCAADSGKLGNKVPAQDMDFLAAVAEVPTCWDEIRGILTQPLRLPLAQGKPEDKG